MTNQTFKCPDFITFTGIDDRTDLTRADQLARQYPIEWGVLFSPSNRNARYPSKQAVSEILEIGGYHSAHLCGDYAKESAKNGYIPSGETPLSRFQRTQINGRNLPIDNIFYLESEFDVNVILQLREQAFNPNANYFELYDCSGGVGLMPESIPELGGAGTLVGYAGGMGPETVTQYLGMIHGEGRFWLDMESLVRTDDWFDLGKVQRVCELVYG